MAALTKHKQKKINLLTQEKFEYTPLGRILNWALSAGRVIVIITELVVILAFLSRFYLDKLTTDLNEQNTALKTQVQAASGFEKDFRSTQKRLAAYKSFEDTAFGAVVREIASLLPAEVSLTNLSFAEKDVTLRGIALSEEGLAGFIKALEASGFEKVSIVDVTLGTSLGQTLDFILKTQLK